MVSLFLSALFLYILARKESHLWLLPPLMALWVNLHGGYLLGLALLLLHIMGEGVSLLKAPQGERRHLKKLSFIFLLSVAFTLINPQGGHPSPAKNVLNFSPEDFFTFRGFLNVGCGLG
ncbi:MAG: hypothetical protein MUP04_07515, partial [Anaerolineae bacterium]|nr:hypothetical protein [Anaerolineae bacterium]